MLRGLKIGENHEIGGLSHAFIIAEIGQNHQGDLETAKNLIKAAKESGAHCVKFQKTDLDAKFNKEALMRPYRGEHSFGQTYGEHKKYLEFSYAQYRELQKFAGSLDILFTASAMDENSLDFLVDELTVPFVKIGSGDANNFKLLNKAAAKRVPLIISTGMQDISTVEDIHRTVSKYHKNFVLLHCVSAYPTPVAHINLNVLHLYREKFPDICIGYSGHELGLDVTLAAIAMGARVIERHLTLDKNQKGSDHKCSLEPLEFKELVTKATLVQNAMGAPVKTRQPSEQACYEKLGKTIVAARELPTGTILQWNDLDVKVAEPKGIDGASMERIIGKEVVRFIKEDESIKINDLIYFLRSYFHT